MAFSGECDDALPSLLPDLPQRQEWTNRSARAEFFGKFSLSNVLRNIIGIDFALWNGPGAIILLTPERTAGMNEQNLEPPSSSANSRRATCSGASAESISPFGMDQAPLSFLRQNGPPG